MCGKEKSVHVEPRHGVVDAIKAVQQAEWIAQQNGENFDVYCSPKCAR
jgi:hypothetical protein